MCIFWSAVLVVVKVVFVNQIFVDDVMTFVGVVVYTIVKYGGVFWMAMSKALCIW